MANHRTGAGADRTATGLLETLASLLTTPTPNPPGNEAAAAEVLEQLFASFGVPTRRVPLGPGRGHSSLSFPVDAPRRWPLFGHLDTVPAVVERWTYPPYGVTIEDDRVYGLGAADMKGGVACIVGAALQFLETDTKTDHTVVPAFTVDEEGDMGSARSLVHEGVFVQTKFLVVAEPNDCQVYVGEKGQLWLRVAFTGQAAHGATPSLGRNAQLAAADLALRLEELATSSSFSEDTTFNVGRLTGGSAWTRFRNTLNCTWTGDSPTPSWTTPSSGRCVGRYVRWRLLGKWWLRGPCCATCLPCEPTPRTPTCGRLRLWPMPRSVAGLRRRWHLMPPMQKSSFPQRRSHSRCWDLGVSLRLMVRMSTCSCSRLCALRWHWPRSCAGCERMMG